MAGNELVPVAGAVVRQEFGGNQQVELRAETAAAAVAAREQAAVNARYLMALQRPRDVENFRVAILKECGRPGFAELAEYHRPVGREYNKLTGEWEEKIATGPSIHLIRTAVALYKNMMVDSATMYESQEMRLVHAYALDLEGNVSWGKTITLSKLVEKRAERDRKTKAVGPPEGRVIVSERINSKGETTYTVIATEDEIRVKEARLVAIQQRENCRSILPRDIVDEALAKARGVLAQADAQDPDAAKRKVIDAFAEFGVTPDDLTEYLTHSLERVSPAELKELRGLFVSMREGDATWDSIMEHKNPAGTKEAAADVGKKKLEELGGKKKDAATDITTPSKAKVNKGGESEGAKPESSAQAAQGTAEPSPTQKGDLAPEKKTDGEPELSLFQQSIQSYRESIGDQAWFRILGANGCESIQDIAEKNWKTVGQEMEQEHKDQRAEKAKQAETKPQGRLKL